MHTSLKLTGIVVLAACAAGQRVADPAPPRSRRGIEWAAYAHDQHGTRYSPAALITPANVAQLVPVWTYRTGDYTLPPNAIRDETTPLVVDGVLYLSTPFGGVRALDPETGAERWAFDPELDLHGDYGDPANRGLSTWEDPQRPRGAACHRRLFVAPLDARLIALDAATGTPCADFGAHGVVHLEQGLSNAPKYKGEYEITSPPAVVNGLVIVGSTVADNQRVDAPSGSVRAFDARTGAVRWTWDPIPRDPRDPAYDTWKGPVAHRTGAANAWSPISADSARDLVFVPVGSASPDFYGGERLGQNLYANSLVALRASTGAVVWHFQVVHHDLWDYDVPAQPVLFTMHRGGRDIPAVAQTTKMGYVFVLNRETGAPLFPVEERPVPASDVPGETAWPTQPVPTLPKPLVPSAMSRDSVFGLTPAARQWCRAKLAGLRSEGIFTPPSLRGTAIFPGNLGGSNWSGLAVDPVRELAFVPTNRLVTAVTLIPRANYTQARREGRDLEISPQAGTPFAMKREFLVSPAGTPCNPPPWGTLTAIDLASGQVAWDVPLGSIKALASVPGSTSWGSPNLGGAMVTAGGVVFAGGAMDQRLHAYDEATGREVWSAELPAGVHAMPMTYTTASGRQYVVVAAGGHRELHDPPGDYVVAFALPDPARAPEPAASITSGAYEGYLVADRTRFYARFTMRVDGPSITATVTSAAPRADGRATGRVTGDSLAAEVTLSVPDLHCSIIMHLTGALANRGVAVIGELHYADACDGSNMSKSGTFSLWKSGRRLVRLAP